MESKQEFELYCGRNPRLGEADQYRQFSKQLFKQERFDVAVIYADQVIIVLERTGSEVPMDDYLHAEACAYAAGEYSRALMFVETLIAHEPGNHEFLLRTGLYNMMLGKNDVAERFYLEARDIKPDHINTCDALAHIYGLLNQHDKVKFYGNKALKLKDAEAMHQDNLERLYPIVGKDFKIKSKVPKFTPETPEKNVIAFSLWGNKHKYIAGAIMNASFAKIIYPGWSCRFYCDTSVPNEVVSKLNALGADVRVLEKNRLPFFGLFWRFFIADDEKVDRYLIRDCDCILNCQERVAVDEWIQSGKHFHIMRDYASHTELIHAGMWGGVRGAIPNIVELIVNYYDNNGKERTIDQHFLRYRLWPIVKQSNLCHDSHYSFSNARKFPVLGRCPKQLGNVGMDWEVFYNKDNGRPLLNF